MSGEIEPIRYIFVYNGINTEKEKNNSVIMYLHRSSEERQSVDTTLVVRRFDRVGFFSRALTRYFDLASTRLDIRI